MHAIALRPLTREDLPLVSGWLAQPHVARWWRDPSDLAAVEAKYLPCLTGQEPTEVFVIEVDRSPAAVALRLARGQVAGWPATRARISLRHCSVWRTWLNVNTCRPSTAEAGAASVGPVRSRSRSGL